MSIRVAAALIVSVAAFSALAGHAGQHKGATGRPVPATIPVEHRGEAYLGGGCFWCLEAAFERLEGVGDVESGYAGGTVERPTYEDVCTGRTGHAEVVRIPYDRRRISYGELLRAFLVVHDPTTLNRQGPDIGTQYRSIVLPRSEVETREAQQVLRAAQSHFERPITTEILPLKRFWAAEPDHQDYFARHPDVPYCGLVIRPKLEKLEQAYRARLKASPSPSPQ